MVVYLFLLLLAIASSGFLLGRFKARAAGVGQDVKMHSLDGYHGWFVAAWAGIPAVLLTLLWLLFQGPVIDWLLVGSLPANKVQAIDGGKLQLLVSQIKSVAAGNIFSQPEPFVVEAAERYNRWKDIASWSLFAVATVLALVGLLVARSRISPRFRARNGVETIMSGLMIACSVIAILSRVRGSSAREQKVWISLDRIWALQLTPLIFANRSCWIFRAWITRARMSRECSPGWREDSS